MDIPADATTQRLATLVTAHLRAPSYIATDDATGDPVLRFDPPLDAAEGLLFARLARLARSHVPDITPAEWQALEPRLDEIRTLRTRTPAEWNALTAAAREADEVSWLRDLTDVLRAMLRD